MLAIPILSSNGLPGRIIQAPLIDIQIDCILAVKRSSEWVRTDVAIEFGAALTAHRQRVPEKMTIECICSDVEPNFGAFITGRWEPDHTRLFADRLKQAQASQFELMVWSGDQFEMTPAGLAVWVLDVIDGPTYEGVEKGSSKFTLTFGESPRFATLFSAAAAVAAAALADVLAGAAERGRQSTIAATAAAAAQIGAAVWP